MNLTKPVILDDTKLLVWVRDSFLQTSTQKVAAVKRHAINDFKAIQYTKKIKTAPGRSSCIAATSASSAVPPVAPSKPTKPAQPIIMSTEYSHLRRYLLEDLLFCSTGHAVVICVAPQHPDYNVFAVLEAKSTIKILNRVIGKVTYLQLNAVITKHACRKDLLEGTIDIGTMRHLLFENGNKSIGFEFIPACYEELLLTWKSFFCYPNSIQIWGLLPPWRNLYLSAFCPIRLDANRSALFQQLSIEIVAIHNKLIG